MATVLAMNPSPHPRRLKIDPCIVRGVPPCRTSEHFTVEFKLGLDLSPLRPRQRLVARTLIQRILAGKFPPAPVGPRA